MKPETVFDGFEPLWIVVYLLVSLGVIFITVWFRRSLKEDDKRIETLRALEEDRARHKFDSKVIAQHAWVGDVNDNQEVNIDSIRQAVATHQAGVAK